MKTLISTIFLSLSLITNADELQTLTLGSETYRATVKSNVVYFNVIGKGTPNKTNVEGWLSLKTNLINQGYSFQSSEIKKSSPIKPYLKEDLVTKQENDFNKEMQRQEEAQRQAIAKEMVERAGLIGYKMKQRDERIAEGLSYIGRK